MIYYRTILVLRNQKRHTKWEEQERNLTTKHTFVEVGRLH